MVLLSIAVFMEAHKTSSTDKSSYFIISSVSVYIYVEDTNPDFFIHVHSSLFFSCN